jgi:hypothetical protein
MFNLFANTSENLLGLRWIGVAEIEEIATRSRERSAEEGNIVTENVRSGRKDRRLHSRRGLRVSDLRVKV